MLARAHTFTIDGLHTRHVAVEVDIRSGLPSFTIVGLADTAVREARERIQAAIRNADFQFPSKRITANLAPGDVRKAGAGLDLAIACALLCASGQLSAEGVDGLERTALFGELSLDGRVRPCPGALAVAEAAARTGLATIALAPERAREAALVGGVAVAAVGDLRSAVRVLEGGAADALPSGDTRAAAPRTGEVGALELGEVRGQRHAVRAAVIAAAGAHNLLMSGPPGTGKTMLAQRIPSILPPLSASEAVEVTRIRSLLGERTERLASTRPFRAPHHTITAAGMVGGARRGSVGEVVLAHNGVLFLDELSEFARPTLEALRQPLEDGRVAIVRTARSAVYPSRFMLVAATNPCPCGQGGGRERCGCSDSELARYRRRLSGPLLDRIDLHVDFANEHPHPNGEGRALSSARARELVRLARERQALRLREQSTRVNAALDARGLRLHARLDAAGELMLQTACERGLLSARGAHRVLRVARTIADLRGAQNVSARDVGPALALRQTGAPMDAGRAA